MLLELMPSESLAALLAVSRQHRRQVHEHVRYITVPDQEHIQTLVRGTWPRLVVWHVGGLRGCIGPWRCSLPNASDAAVLLLAKGHWLVSQQVILEGNRPGLNVCNCTYISNRTCDFLCLGQVMGH